MKALLKSRVRCVRRVLINFPSIIILTKIPEFSLVYRFHHDTYDTCDTNFMKKRQRI